MIDAVKVCPKVLTYRKGQVIMNNAVRDIAKWATSQGYRVQDDAKGYTRFYDPDGNYVARYPATPSNPRRRHADLTVALKRSGLELPPPSKKQLRSRRQKGT
jgi:hypothetical protein